MYTVENFPSKKKLKDAVKRYNDGYRTRQRTVPRTSKVRITRSRISSTRK